MTYFRIHPAINIGRVGNSEEYYIAPETMAGELVDKESGLFGGLPIKKGTESTPITESDFRDEDSNVVRQAARYRIYAYQDEQQSYPGEDHGAEIKPGATLPDGRVIRDVVWTVHLANKKNNNYKIVNYSDEEGIFPYQEKATPPLRNFISLTPPPESGKTQEQWDELIAPYLDANKDVDPNYNYSDDISDPRRRTDLVIDAGPRALSALAEGVKCFDEKSGCCYADASGTIRDQENYPKSFPNHLKLKNLYEPITTLGEMRIEEGTGRLLITGGYGRISGIVNGKGALPPLNDAIDNDFWFDDTSDGSVRATLVFDDGTAEEAVSAWFTCTDPGYAPQTKNVVSTWDDAFATWVEELDLIPDLFTGGKYQASFPASFESDILPILHGAFLQRWNTSLPSQAINGHNYMGQITPQDNGSDVLPNFKSLIRNPGVALDEAGNATPDESAAENDVGKMMPLALGDASKSYLSLSNAQYFLMNQWHSGRATAEARDMGGGEKLDKNVLENCLGGRYSPGIDLTFIVRDVNFYQQTWKGKVGPFRLNSQPLDYSQATKDEPFLGVGYVPLRQAPVEPGDVCKFMSQPWHTDYNSCAEHTPDPNPPANNTLYWSWPAQRPVQVYPKGLCHYDSQKGTWSVGGQVYSVRGDGEGDGNPTHTNLPENKGKYQTYLEYAENWHRVGFIIQGLQVKDEEHGGNYGADKFIEVCSEFDSRGDTVMPWPTASTDDGVVT